MNMNVKKTEQHALESSCKTRVYSCAFFAMIIFSLLTLPACTSSSPLASDGGFDSANPASKLYAIRQAGDRKDWKDVPKLVEQLNSDDPAVRVFAIVALEEITNKQRGEYDPYGPLLARQKAIVEWKKACDKWDAQGKIKKQKL